MSSGAQRNNSNTLMNSGQFMFRIRNLIFWILILTLLMQVVKLKFFLSDFVLLIYYVSMCVICFGLFVLFCFVFSFHVVSYVCLYSLSYIHSWITSFFLISVRIPWLSSLLFICTIHEVVKNYLDTLLKEKKRFSWLLSKFLNSLNAFNRHLLETLWSFSVL